ncbi:hypothetical protein KGQ20_02435 [Catenulispora sp. NF23]|uniref:Uncharacterized protein n=1 Tax=Catenulispora pinistramenti TaxID=2705254 RepID=A0ABS5L516_9ACTN|nr:hypothetical protein [Catenulispora pinistramenti]MBS2531623.1 hypothetical protein [Catenulispora pinistramenti]MBS2553448.1 hypothetical protein [Catenulispora pinistramenti]
MADLSLKFLIDADHGQFYVQDLDPYEVWLEDHGFDPQPAGGWTDDALTVHRIGLEPHSISVGTARDDLVEAQIIVHTSAPALDSAAVHIVEADLDAPTGHLAVSSPGVDPADGPSIVVPAGLLRARVSYVPSEPPVRDTNGGPGDHFLYRIDLWQVGQAREIVVIKQGPSSWAQ